MGQFLGVLFLVIVLAALGGALYIAMGDIPPPTETIEKIIPDDRFPK